MPFQYTIGYREREPYAEVELGDGVVVGAWGSTLLSAFSNAAKLARNVADDPVLSSMLPPPIGPALKAATKLADAAQRDELLEFMPYVRGPGAKRLARKLADLRRKERDLRDGGRRVTRDWRNAP